MMIEQVIFFNSAILKIHRDKPELLKPQEAKWLRNALLEEIQEFEHAHNMHNDLVGSVDALIDLIYFAIGGLYRLGLDEDRIEACFDAVHQVNIKKKLGVKATRPQDGTVADAVKVNGVEGPEEQIREILREW